MKNVILLLLLIIPISSLFSQHKIQIIGIDASVVEYSVNDISNISFNLSSITIVKVNHSDNIEDEIEINSDSEITFTEDLAVFKGIESTLEFSLEDINSIKFENTEIENLYPFGELDVDQIIVDNLDNPWSIDFIDDDNLIFTEKDGRLFRYNLIEGELSQIQGLPNIANTGQGGLLDVTLHPDFTENSLVYLVYSVGENQVFTTAVGRGTLVDNQLLNFEELFRGDPLLSGGQHFGSRIIFDNNNKLYFAIGDRGRMDNAQDSTNHYGSVLRINDDGSIPDDNPYLNAKDAKPELYTMGNRNIQGMFYLDTKDEIWAIEHGPRGGDELNLIKPGENYAWPLATFGINYNGTPITEQTSIPGYIDPITYWVPSIAPCGMDLINYDESTNELDIIIATLAGTHLHRIKVKDYKVTETVMSLESYARFRDVQLSTNGYLYATTQNPGRIIRLKTKE
ncbi:PQQ-dependent sugar dehydrogenase [Candidatus Kapabacteria bacterium]|nr:PQQ-dependent sugar dehydrogenase [Candidatus Kapabacteria bacterium]